MLCKKIAIQGRDLPIRTFKLSWFCKEPIICMIAKRGSGKSWVCRDILNYLNKKSPYGVIISPTDHVNPFYEKFFCGLYIHNEYTPDILDKIFYRQQKLKKKLDEKIKQKKKINIGTILLMDDCLSGKKKWINEENIRKVFFNGRHSKLTFILTMQYPLGIPPDLRSNFDYIFLLADDSYNNQKKLYDNYASFFPNVNAFRQVFNELTSDYGCMVIVNTNRGGSRKDLWDKIFWYRAGKEEIQYGTTQFKKIHEKNYNKDWKDHQYDFNMENIMKKKNSSLKINLIG